jgi:hypothetical protein
MAGQPTLWGAAEFLRSFFSQTATPPANFWLALVQEIPANAFVSGSELDEPDIADGYGRVAIPNDATNWSNAGINDQLHLVANQLDVTFDVATGDWGSVGYWALCSAETAGNVYFTGQMEVPKLVMTGDQPVVPSHVLLIELGPFNKVE